MKVETWIRIIKLKEAVKLYCYGSVAMALLKSMNNEVIPIEKAQHAMENFGSKD